MNKKTTLKDFAMGGIKTIKNNKSLFFISFFAIFIITLVNTYFEQTVTVGDLQNVGNIETMGLREIIGSIFKILPILIFPSIFAVIASQSSESKFVNLSYILTPLRKFRFYIMFLSTITIFAAVVAVSMVSFSGVIEKGFEFHKHQIETNSFLQKFDSSIIRDENIDYTPIEKSNIDKYNTITEKSILLEEQLTEELSNITTVDVTITVALLIFVAAFYLNYYIVSSALITTTNSGFFRIVKISAISFFKNIKFITVVFLFWVLSNYITKILFFDIFEFSDATTAIAALLDSITSVVILFYISYIIFKTLFLDNSISKIGIFDESNKNKFFNVKPMLGRHINFERFNFESIEEANKEKENESSELKEEVVKNKLRK